eukprot:975398-Prymnesium_polylepis.1
MTAQPRTCTSDHAVWPSSLISSTDRAGAFPAAFEDAVPALAPPRLPLPAGPARRVLGSSDGCSLLHSTVSTHH